MELVLSRPEGELGCRGSTLAIFPGTNFKREAHMYQRLAACQVTHRLSITVCESIGTEVLNLGYFVS
jgi:hypothetical protein